MSGVYNSINCNNSKIFSKLTEGEKDFLAKRPSSLNSLMQNVLRLSDGRFSILDIAEKIHMPFNIVYQYLVLLKENKLIRFINSRK